MTRFRAFCYSPTFNKHKDVRRLVDLINKLFPDFNERNCDRKRLYKRIYPGQVHDQAALALVFSYTMRLMEQFLIQEEFGDLTHFKKILLMRRLRKLGRPKLYHRVLADHQKVLEHTEGKDSSFYNLSYLTAAEADQFYSEKGGFEKDNSIQVKQDNLDYFYFSEKLKDACEMAQRSRILKINYSTGLLDSILEHIDSQWDVYQKIPPVVVYYSLYKMITNATVEFFYKAREAIEKNENYFPIGEKISIYNYLQNYSIQQVNKGDQQFLKELFEVYKIQLNKGLLYVNDYLPEWHYKNIVSNGIQLKETVWVYDFIETYKHRLHPQLQENAYSFNIASYYYATQQYTKAQQLLVQLEYTDIRYNLGAKILLLKTYYDLEEYEALLSLSESFKQYLSRNKTIADFKRQGYNNLLKLTRKCFQIKMKKVFVGEKKYESEKQKLKQAVKATQPIFNQNWLEIKLAEL